MRNHMLFEELKQSREYKVFKKHRITRAIMTAAVALLFTIIMLFSLDPTDIISVLPCGFMACAFLVTGAYAIYSAMPPAL